MATDDPSRIVRLVGVYDADGSAVELVGRDELHGLAGSVDSFGTLVRDRLTAGQAEPQV